MEKTVGSLYGGGEHCLKRGTRIKRGGNWKGSGKLSRLRATGGIPPVGGERGVN